MTAGLALGAGCTPVEEDPFFDEGDIDIAFAFTADLDDGAIGDCVDFGGDTFTATLVDNFDGTVIEADGFCEEGGITIVNLLEGNYDVSLEFFDTTGALAAVSAVELAVPVFGGDLTAVDFVLASDGGYLGYAWDLEEVDDITGETLRQLSCDQVNADGLRITANNLDLAKTDIIIMPCDQFEFFGDGKLFFGRYEMQIDLVQGNVGLSDIIVIDEVRIDVANEVEDLGQVIFEFLDSDIPG